MYTEQHDTRGVRTHALSEWRLEPPPQTARPKCLRWENKGAGYIYIYIWSPDLPTEPYANGWLITDSECRVEMFATVFQLVQHDVELA